MNILRINTSPSFQIVPRENLDVSRLLNVAIKNEDTQEVQNINATVSLLENENYQLTLVSFPTGNQNEKFSYTITDILTNNVVSLGKILIVAEDQNIQDYTTTTTNKFYN